MSISEILFEYIWLISYLYSTTTSFCVTSVNKQVLENSDLLIGIFWTRIGSPTGDSISGSVEEIEKHVAVGKPAMLYFSSAPVVPDSIDMQQYEELKRFKRICYKKGLVESFDSMEELRIKLTRQLSLKIIQHDYFQVSDDLFEYSTENIQNDTQSLLDDLTETEMLLILEASEDSSGEIIKMSYKDGFNIRANGKILNKDDNPRTRALWESTFDNLISKDLIKDIGYKGEVFTLTLLGYKIADLLKEGK